MLATWLVQRAGAGDLPGPIWNTTTSSPRGLYWAAPVTRAIVPGDLVVICPWPAPIISAAIRAALLPQGSRTYCHEAASIPLLKPVVAIAGDTVTVDERGIAASQLGQLALSTPIVLPREDPRWAAVVPMPRASYLVGADELWLVAPRAESWDSRYFGPAPRAAVIAIATPIVTIE